jgi:hypothetical protein
VALASWLDANTAMSWRHHQGSRASADSKVHEDGDQNVNRRVADASWNEAPLSRCGDGLHVETTGIERSGDADSERNAVLADDDR